MDFLQVLLKAWGVNMADPANAAIFVFTTILVVWGLLYFLYRHKIGNLESSLGHKDAEIRLLDRQKKDLEDINRVQKAVAAKSPAQPPTSAFVPVVTGNASLTSSFVALTSAEGLRLRVDPTQKTLTLTRPLLEYELADLSAAKLFLKEGLVEKVKETGEGYTAVASGSATDLRSLYDQKTEKDDWKLSDWTGHDTYYIWAAACLWMNVKPVPKIGSDHLAYPIMQRIKAAIEGGKITSLSGGANMMARIHKDELIKLANSNGEKPKFLFPG